MPRMHSRRDVFRWALAVLLAPFGLLNPAGACGATARPRPPRGRAAPSTAVPFPGQTTIFSYDAGGRVDLIPNDPEHCSVTTYTYAYDAAGPLSFNGRT